MTENDPFDPHFHCDFCIKINKCNTKSSDSCPIITCMLDCGAKFHGCKASEHQSLCPNEKVNCLNHNYGCPFTIQRKQIVKHLVSCPASVVHCSVEWNRWPVHTREKRLAQPIIMSQAFDVNHLDVALALRDQRMLKELFSVPRRTRCTFRNSLTKKYPAVPLKPYHGLHRAESSNSNGLISPTNTNLTSQTSDDDSDSSPWKYKYPPGLQSSVCAYLNGHNTTSPINVKDDHSVEDISSSNTHPSFPEEIGNKIVIPPPPPSLPQCPSLSLDLNIDAIAPYQPKPKLMYTFRCAQEFRRDEYEAHYKNTHSDIHGSINDWMEHRCPLFQYGCNFAQRRIHPKPKDSRIVYNSVVESFGLLMLPPTMPSSDPNINLMSLPFEIIQFICKYLDGFSLNNLALTSKKLRDICSTLLDDRGLVVLQWERQSNDDSNVKWEIGGKRWFFSTSYSRVDEWYLDDHHAILNHMKECAHYEKVIKTEPFKLPSIQSRESKKKI